MSCDCSIWPFKPDPPCFNICVAAMLDEVSAEELQLVIGVPDKIAKTIASFTKGKKLEALVDYKKVLSPDEMGFLENKIRSLNQVQVKYLMNPLETRYDVIRNLKANVIDLDIK